MNKTKIEWCDYTWNPVWGCLNKCPYCYARKLNNRYGIIDKEFNPTWMDKNFNRPFPKKPVRIFVNSMSDIAFWEDEWMDKVLDKIEQYPQHTFLFLTKNPKSYNRFNDIPRNCWLGFTVTNQNDVNNLAYQLEGMGIYDSNKIFISMEPIADHIKKWLLTDWVIIGAETGNRKNKIIPKREWIIEIKEGCEAMVIPLFMKDSLKELMGDDFIQEYPR